MPDTPLATPSPSTADKNVKREGQGYAFGLPEAGAVGAGKAIGGAVSTATSFLGVLGRLEFWKGLGLIIAGGIILAITGINLLRA